MTGEKILVIEDNRVLAMGLETFLVTHGYQVQLASNGLEALVSCQQKLPDLVISDVFMRQMDGVAFLQELRAMPGADGLPVLMITGQTDQSMLSKIKSLNVTKCFPKPFDLKALLNAIELALSPSVLS